MGRSGLNSTNAVCMCSNRPLEVPSVLVYNSRILPNGSRCSERKVAGFRKEDLLFRKVNLQNMVC